MKLKAQPPRGFRRAVLAVALATTLPAACAPRTPSPISNPEPPLERPAPSRVPDRSPPATPPPAPPLRPGACGRSGADPASAANALSLVTLSWAPFRRPEIGWETYAVRIGQEIASPCAPDTPGFAAALRAWQRAEGAPADGRMSEAAFQRMKARWQDERPLVRAAGRGLCPPPPPAVALVPARISEGYMGKPVMLRPGALAAYRRMVEAARQDPLVRADPRNLTIFSAYRSPASDAARCLAERNCDGVARATCSPHRTGLAVDLFVGAAPGFGPDSTVDANRRFQSKTAAYRWLVRNAGRFGFANYPFEPWHWEWTGEAP